MSSAYCPCPFHESWSHRAVVKAQNDSHATMKSEEKVVNFFGTPSCVQNPYQQHDGNLPREQTDETPPLVLGLAATQRDRVQISVVHVADDDRIRSLVVVGGPVHVFSLGWRARTSARLCDVGHARASFLHDLPRLRARVLLPRRGSVDESLEPRFPGSVRSDVCDAYRLERGARLAPLQRRASGAGRLQLGRDRLPHPFRVRSAFRLEAACLESDTTSSPLFRARPHLDLVFQDEASIRAASGQEGRVSMPEQDDESRLGSVSIRTGCKMERALHRSRGGLSGHVGRGDPLPPSARVPDGVRSNVGRVDKKGCRSARVLLSGSSSLSEVVHAGDRVSPHTSFPDQYPWVHAAVGARRRATWFLGRRGRAPSSLGRVDVLDLDRVRRRGPRVRHLFGGDASAPVSGKETR